MVIAVEGACKVHSVMQMSESTKKNSPTAADRLDCHVVQEIGNITSEVNTMMALEL